MLSEINHIATNVKHASHSGLGDVKPCGCEVVLENSPVGESQSNGLAENAVREVQGQTRALKSKQKINTSMKKRINFSLTDTSQDHAPSVMPKELMVINVRNVDRRFHPES